MNQKSLFLSILFGIVLLGVGVLAGLLVSEQTLAPKAEGAQNILKALNSKLIPSIMAFGEVKNLSGKNLTLSYGGDEISIKIRDDAKISILEGSASATPTAAGIGDIKLGDYLNVGIKITSDGTIEASTVLILSSLTKTQ